MNNLQKIKQMNIEELAVFLFGSRCQGVLISATSAMAHSLTKNLVPQELRSF